jgi:hypothetical protein
MRKPLAVTRRYSSLSRGLCIAVALGATAVVAATLPPQAATRPERAVCGVELWSLKTLSDPQRRLVNLHPRNTTVAAITGLPRPYPTPRTRNTVYERRAWRRAIIAARATFVRRCGFPTLDRQPLGAVALVSGVGFWDVRARAERRRAKLRRAASGDRASPHRRLRVAASRRSRGDACEAGNCRSVSTQL